MFERLIQGAEQQEELGAKLAGYCMPPAVIYLQGELGSGKTTLVRGFLRALDYRGRVKSPTYTILESYDLERMICHHFDLYRLADPQELEYLGLSDLLDRRSVLLIEWPEQGEGCLPAADIIIKMQHEGLSRRVSLQALTGMGNDIIHNLQ